MVKKSFMLPAGNYTRPYRRKKAPKKEKVPIKRKTAKISFKNEKDKVTIPYRRRGGKPRSNTIKTLTKRVNDLSKTVKSNTTTQIWKSIAVFTARASQNQCVYGEVGGVSTSDIESAISTLRYYDPATGNLTTSNYGSASTAKSIHINVYTKVMLRNNYRVPANVTCYVVVPKQDTSISPGTAIADGLTDAGVSSSSTNILHYPSESVQFNYLWRVVESKTTILSPEQEMTLTFNKKNIMYDPSVVDSHAFTWQQKYGCHRIFVRVSGVQAHDSTLAQYGIAPAGIDCIDQKRLTMTYDGGADLTYFVDNNALTNFTNAGNVSMYSTDQENYGL